MRSVLPVLMLLFSASCGGGGGSLPEAPVSSGSESGAASNNVPSFVSSDSVFVVEHQLEATTIEIDDADTDDSLSLEISGGDDKELFELGVCNTARCTSNSLTFRSAPDFEAPSDTNQDNSYEIVISASDGKDTVYQDLKISVTNYVFDEDGKEELRSVEWNTPSLNETEDVCITGLDVPESHKLFCEEVYALLRSTLGGYPNYLHVIWNENGTEADAKPVLDKLTTIVGEEQRLEDLYQCCLCGRKDRSDESNLSSYHGVCHLTLGFTSNPFDADWPEFDRYGQIALVYAHEYFHHYQNAHALERTPHFSPNNTSYVEEPDWWSEGAAVAFENAWLEAYFYNLEVYSNSALSDVAAVGRTWNDSVSFKQIRRALMGADGEKIESCSSDWVMTEAEEDFDTWGGCHAVFLVPSYLAHLTSWETVFVDIPATYYDLGFWGAVHSFTGLTKPEFYANFNEFMRSGDAEDEPPPGWELTSNEFLVVDFLNIDYERL